MSHKTASLFWCALSTITATAVGVSLFHQPIESPLMLMVGCLLFVANAMCAVYMLMDALKGDL